MFKEGNLRYCDIVTDDESWIYYRQVQKKQMNLSWVYTDEKPLAVVKRNQFEAKSIKNIFFKFTGPLLIETYNKADFYALFRQANKDLYDANICLDRLTKISYNFYELMDCFKKN